MIDKIAYQVQMSFDVPKEEKHLAEKCIEYFSLVMNHCELTNDYLNKIYDPFSSEGASATPEELHEKRGLLNRYKQSLKKRYNKIKLLAFYAMQLFNNFSNDTRSIELINAFESDFNILIKSVEDVLDVLSNYKSESFKDSLLASIDIVKKESAELEQLIRDRIIDHLNSNILNTSWSKDLGEIKNKEPALISIHQNNVPHIQKRPQVLNPTNTQSTLNPSDLRNETKLST